MQQRDRAAPVALEAYEALCQELGEHPGRRRTRHGCCNNPVVTAPIIGPRTLEHLTGEPTVAGDHPFRGNAPRARRRDLARPRRRSASGLRLGTGSVGRIACKED